MKKKSKPKRPSELVVSDLDTLKVLSDPLRLKILQLFAEGHQTPRTVKAIAAMLDLPPTKLYYHINLLEKHGLIRVAETNVVSGIIEKSYEPAAENIRVEVDHKLLAPDTSVGDENLNALLSSVLDHTKDEIRASVRSGIIKLGKTVAPTEKLSLSRSLTYLTPAQAKRFHQRLNKLLDEFSTAGDKPRAKGQGYALVLALYPIQSTAEDTRKESKDE